LISIAAIAVFNSAYVVTTLRRSTTAAVPVTARFIYRAGIAPSVTTVLVSPIVTGPHINPITAGHIIFSAALFAPVVYTAFTFLRFAVEVIAFGRTTSLTGSTLVRIICA